MHENILNIDTNNLAVKFIYDRLNSRKYRGFHLVQHERTSYSELVGVLLVVYAVVGEGKMPIPKGDPTSDEHVKDFQKFKQATKLYMSIFEKGSYKALKKISFVNLNRMGLIDRYDNKNKLVKPNSRRKHIKSISISELGLKLILNPDNSRYLFLRALDVLLKGFMPDFLWILQREEFKKGISFDEFFLFVSYLGLKLDSSSEYVDSNMVIKLITSYRGLRKHQRERIYDELNKISKETKHLGKANGQIDLGNWRNQSQTIFNFLSFAANITVDNNKIFFGKKKKGSAVTLDRSIKEKEKYFNKHNINRDNWKGQGYELHHIYPLAYAENDEQFLKIDSWENLIYIDGRKHAEITQRRNMYLKLDFDDDSNIIFSRINDDTDQIVAIKDENVIYEVNNKELMLNKNNELLEL